MEEYIDAYCSGFGAPIHIKRYIGNCDIDLAYKSNAEYFKRYSRAPNATPADGCSGGAIFSLIGGATNFEIVLDGVVVRGGLRDVYIVDADYLIKLMQGVQS